VKIAKLVFDIILSSMDLVITQSEEMSNEIMKKIKLKNKCVIIPNGVDLIPEITSMIVKILNCYLQEM